jgi:hypothetical protein
MSTMAVSLCCGGSQSMSKWDAYRLDGPFSSTSHHQALSRPARAMWLGTMSSTWPSPAWPSRLVIRACPASPPSSAFSRPWSTTS